MKKFFINRKEGRCLSSPLVNTRFNNLKGKEEI